MISPRLTDPRSRSDYFLGLFRFTEQKDIVEAALKSRMYTINSAMFSKVVPNTFVKEGWEQTDKLSNPSAKRRNNSKFGKASAGRGPGLRIRYEDSTPIIAETLYSSMIDMNLDSDIGHHQKEDSYSNLDSIERIDSNAAESSESDAVDFNQSSSSLEVGSPQWQAIISRRMQRRLFKLDRNTFQRTPQRSTAFEHTDTTTINSHIDWPSFDSGALQETKHISLYRRATEPIVLKSLLYEPEAKQGWLKKYSRDGLFKNWRSRYFVLSGGKLVYYENKVTTFVGSIEKVCCM